MRALKSFILSALLAVSAGASATLTQPMVAGQNYIAPTGDASQTKVTATGSTAARALADRAAEVYNVKDYGSATTCNGASDDSTAINAAISAIRAKSILSGSLGYQIGRNARLVFPTNGVCKISSTLNFTILYGSGVVWDQRGAVIVCSTNGTPCVDATGTGRVLWEGLNIQGSSTNSPNIGLLLARTTNNSIGADDNYLSRPVVTGTFTLAAYYNRSAEQTTIIQGAFDNAANNSYTGIWDGSNHFNVQSAFTGQTYPADNYTSNLENLCFNCTFGNRGYNSTPIWIGGATLISFQNTYGYWSGAAGGSPGPGIQLYQASGVTNNFVTLDIHMEDFGGNSTLQSYLQFTGSLATVTVNGLTVRDNSPQYTGTLFELDTGVTAVNIQNADIRIGKEFNSGTKWFDTASAYSISGFVYSQNGTYNDPASFQGMKCVGNSCTATNVVGSGSVQAATITNAGAIQTVVPATPSGGAGSWRSIDLAGNLPSVAISPPGNGGATAKASMTNILLTGQPSLRGGSGCSVGTVYSIVDPQSGGGPVSGAATLTVSSIDGSGAVTGSTYGTAFTWNKPFSSGTGVVYTSGPTCTTDPAMLKTGAYPTSSWSYSNGGGTLKATFSVTDSGAGYAADPTITVFPNFNTQPGGTGLPLFTYSYSTAVTVSGTPVTLSGGGATETLAASAITVSPVNGTPLTVQTQGSTGSTELRTISPIAGLAALHTFYDGATQRWQVGKDASNNLVVYDVTRAANAMSIGPNGNTTFGGGNVIVKQASGTTSVIKIDTPSASASAYTDLLDSGTTYWRYGKNGSNQFFVQDIVNGRTDLSIASNGDMTLMGTSGNLILGNAAGTENLKGSVQLNGRSWQFSTAPTIASGFGTGAALVSAASTQGFRLSVGTGGTASSGVLTFPSATAGWACSAQDVTNNGTAVTTAFSTSATSVSVQNYSRTTGALTAWAANDVIEFQCTGY